jgi:WD40 repeat protein
LQANRLLNECPAPLRGWEWRFLERRLAAPGQVLRYAQSDLGATAVAISPNDRTIVAATKGKAKQPARVETWDRATGQSLKNWIVPIVDGPEIALSPDAAKYAVHLRVDSSNPSSDCRVTVFDVSTGERLQSWVSACQGIAALQWSPDSQWIAVGGLDGSLIIYDAVKSREVKALRLSGDPWSQIAWSPDARTLAAVSSPVNPRELSHRNYDEQFAELSLFDWESGQRKWASTVPLLPPFPFRTHRLCFAPDGRHLLVSTGVTTSPRVLNAANGETVAIPPEAAIVAFTPDGKSALGVLPVGIGVLVDLDSQRTTATFHFREPKRVKAGSLELNRGRSTAAFSQDGKQFAFAHDDGRISVWDVATNRELCTLPGARKATSLQFSSDGQTLVAAAIDGSVAKWNLIEAPESRMLAAAEALTSYSTLAVSPDGSTLAAIRTPAGSNWSETASIVLWDLPSRRVRHVIPAPVLGVGWAMPGMGELQFRNDGKYLCASGVVRDGPPFNWYSRAVGVWDMETRTAQIADRERLNVSGAHTIYVAEPLVPSMELDQYRVRYRTDHRFAQLLVRGRSVEHPSPRPVVELSHWDDADQAWSPPNGESIRSASLSADGRRCIVTRSGTKDDKALPSMEVWDVDQRRLLWQLNSQSQARQLAATFSPDGRRIFTQPIHASAMAAEPWTRRAAVWDADNGQLLCDFAPPTIAGPYGEQRHSRFVFSHDGQRLASFGATKGIKIWDANSGLCLLSIGDSGGIVNDVVWTSNGLLIARDEHGAIQCWDARGQGQPRNLDAIVRSSP